MGHGFLRLIVATAFTLGMALVVFAFFGMQVGQRVGAADDADTSTANSAKAPIDGKLPDSVKEARGRARLLHETIHGTLQVVHRDFFREDEKLPIPSQSLEDVFAELARSQKMQIRWLAVSTEAMNVDHKPKSDFEKQAVEVLRKGKPEFESIVEGKYHYAGTITLSAQCLKCHLPSRSSNKDRAAGIVIAMPLKEKSQ